MNDSTPRVLHAMLSSRWTLSNRLSLILVASLSRQQEGKLLLKWGNIPALVAGHVTNNNASVREAAEVAVEAFSSQVGVKNLKDLRRRVKLCPKALSMRGRVEDQGLLPSDMGVEVSSRILFLKSPSGLKLSHEGDSISNTSKYLKPINVIPPPAREIRRDSQLGGEAVPWTVSGSAVGQSRW